MRSVRLFFEKTGRAKYISHLDLNRTMIRCLNKSGIPVWYTEGFNPHPFVTFALPLALGIESLYETMDFRVEGDMTEEEICRRLTQVMPEGLRVLQVAAPVMDAAQIVFATYRFVFQPQEEEPMGQRLQEIFSRDSLMAEKLSKKGKKKIMKEINLFEFLETYSIEDQGSGAVLQTVLAAGSQRSLNPILLAETLCRELRLPPYAVDIQKLDSMDGEKRIFC